ncbi:hypothetical protein NQ315_001670 [Exocentrus adspersus]|uniref:WD repeat-containing protein 65 n=1 Tax=Exocentrus adspersus TaxID=1586481 RepID=A0AAV8W8V4_9CUCU|nr:hypothetical protein NQ315_001670 [Exocentrus adspersus]
MFAKSRENTNLAVLQPKLYIGLETRISNNIHFLNDDEVVYPAGSVVVLHNFHVKKQKFIKLTDKGRNLTHVKVSPNKKTIAVVENTDKLPMVTLWCPVQFKKKKTLTLPSEKDIIAHRFVTVDFTFDSKYLVCVTGEPDWTMYCFKCDKGRLESFARAINLNGTGTVRQVACNPQDVNQLVLCGDSVLRCLGCQDYTWRQFGYNKFDNTVYTSCCWLSQDRLIVGSDRGKIMVLETGELKAVFNAMDLPIINMKQEDEMEETSQTSLHSAHSIEIIEGDTQNYEIRGLVNFGRGFAFGFMNGKVHLYEKETPNKYKKRGVYVVPDRTIKREYEEMPKVLTTINTIVFNPSEDRLLVSCSEMQLWTSRLYGNDSSMLNEITMRNFGYPMHLGPVGSVAICRWKPIAMTSGTRDRSIKIWNYETDEVELIHTFEDDISSVALHPTGLYAVIGFSDKLRYMTIMIDDMLMTKEFNIRSCRMTSFSRLGHLFAAANANVIQIYSSITFELMYILKGHIGKIQGMSWSHDDNILASCGSEGAVYGWDVSTASRISEVVIKSNPFTGVALLKDGKSMYAIGHDGHVRELGNSNIQRDVVLTPPSVVLDDIALSQLDTMLFVTGNSGSVYVIKVPLLEKAEYVEYAMHNSPITKMCLSLDDRYLISATDGGHICFWKLMNIEDKSVPFDADVKSSSEILISRQILEDKMDTIKNLQLRMRELETEHSFQMRQNDALYSSKIKDIHSEYCTAIEELKSKNEQMESDHLQETNNLIVQINKIKSEHEVFVQKLENSYNEKLIYEYNKFHRFESKMENLAKEQEQRYELLKESKQETEESLTAEHLQKLKDMEVQIEQLVEQMQQMEKEHEIIVQQVEDDADREIYELKEAHEKELRDEQDLNVPSVLKKKFLAAQKETNDLRQKVVTLDNEHMKFKATILSLDKEILDMKKEMQERDQTIEEKEKRIFQLKSKNQELEKFKFILDFKINELKSIIEPKEKLIQEQLIQINEMVRELENLQKIILNLDVQLAELRDKLIVSNTEVKKEIDKNARMKKALQNIRIDIHHASSFIQNVPKLKQAVKDMYHKYNADKDFEITQAEDTEARSEFLRQRDFLERTVSTLHYQATKNANLLSYDKVRLVDENSCLLDETNLLRKNLREATEQTKKLHALVGLSYISPKMAQKKVNLATDTNTEIHNRYKTKLQENERAITALKEENNRLINKIAQASIEEMQNLSEHAVEISTQDPPSFHDDHDLDME